MEWLTEKKVLATRDINSNSAAETEELTEKQEKVLDMLDKKRKVSLYCIFIISSNSAAETEELTEKQEKVLDNVDMLDKKRKVKNGKIRSSKIHLTNYQMSSVQFCEDFDKIGL